MLKKIAKKKVRQFGFLLQIVFLIGQSEKSEIEIEIEY